MLGAACGALGVWLLHLRQAYAAESLAHAMLPGLVLASLAGVPLLLGAGGGVLVVAALIALAARDERVGSEIAVGVTVTTAFGLGAVLALSPDVPVGLDRLLFGDLLGAGTARPRRRRRAARRSSPRRSPPATAGSPSRCSTPWPRRRSACGPRASSSRCSRCSAIAVVAAVLSLGNLLVFALLVAPAAAAMRLGRSVRAQLWLAAALGSAAGVLGLVASAELDVAAGGSVALAAVALYAVAALARPGAPRGGPARRSPVEALGAGR